MSSSGDEVRRGARWDGARGSSRHRLLLDLQRKHWVVVFVSRFSCPTRRLHPVLSDDPSAAV